MITKHTLFLFLLFRGWMQPFLAFGDSSVGKLRVLACEQTLQVASLWQVSIDAIDFKLKQSVRWSIIRVHSGQQLQCDAWASLPRLSRQCTAIRAKLPWRPSTTSPLPCCPPFLHTAKPSHFTLHGETLFFYYLTTPPHTTISKMLRFLLCSMLELEVHYRVCQVGSSLLSTGQVQPLHQNASLTLSFMFRLKRLSVFVTQASSKLWRLWSSHCEGCWWVSLNDHADGCFTFHTYLTLLLTTFNILHTTSQHTGNCLTPCWLISCCCQSLNSCRVNHTESRAYNSYKSPFVSILFLAQLHYHHMVMWTGCLLWNNFLFVCSRTSVIWVSAFL